MKKTVLIAFLMSLAANFASAAEMKGQLKDGTAVQMDDKNQLWLMKDGKGEKAADGSYVIMHEGKEMNVTVKDGKSVSW